MEFTVQIISLYCIFMYIIFQLCILQKEKMRTNCIKNLTLCILDKNKNKLYSHFTATFFFDLFLFISLFQNFKFQFYFIVSKFQIFNSKLKCLFIHFYSNSFIFLSQFNFNFNLNQNSNFNYKSKLKACQSRNIAK